MRLYEFEENKSFWDLVKYYELGNVNNKFHDSSLPWINNNRPGVINSLLKDPKNNLLSKIYFFITYLPSSRYKTGHRDFGEKVTTLAEFESALSNNMTVWRGGGGLYDPTYSQLKRSWVSFTAKRERANTFSKYDGTYSSKAYMLDTRDSYWIVQLETTLNEILLYLPFGCDEEVIVSKKDAKNAKLILQT